MATGEDMLLIRPPVNRLGNYFRVGNSRGVQRRSAPRHIKRHPREIDDATIAAVAAQIVRRAHEDTVNRARLDAKRTKHALRVVDRVPGDLKPFATLDPLFADVNAIDGASLGALIAGDARRQIKPVKATVPGRNRHGQFGVFKVLGECFSLRPISLDPRPKRYPQSMRNGVDGFDDVAHPGPHSLHFVYHWAERISFCRCSEGERTLRILIVNPVIRRSRSYVESLANEYEL
jgi:hypothetical protein